METATETLAPPPAPAQDFIREMVRAHVEAGRYGGRVVTRFPPEPNGYLHIGHAKSICLNFGIARESGGVCHLRFDDTNPETEEQEYVEAIQRDVRWLGFDWGERMYFASDYFEPLYDFGVDLIRRGKAYICDLSDEEIRAYRGTVTEPGRESPYRGRAIAENLDLFARMRAGEFPDGSRTLRARIDMASPNMKMRDPLLYRIRRATHYHRGDAWCIYPMYDFAHPLSDAIERITHSLCTLEFENNREIYDWLVDTLEFPEPPRQTEFARLALTHTVLSKRKLLELVERGKVSGWDDPRMPTLSGLRRRGFTPEAIRDFCERIGVAKANSTVDVALLEHCQREDLNPRVPRVLSVLRPLRLVVENYPEGHVEELDAPYFPRDVPREGSRAVPFSRVLYIERDDFEEDPPKGFFRLSPGREVRLRYAYVVRCTGVEKDPATGEVTAVRCTYDPATRGGATPDGRKVPGTIHWVSAERSLPAEVRLYDRLFSVERPDLAEGEPMDYLNPESRVVLAGSRIEASLASARPGNRFQFERQGYFYLEPEGSEPGRPVFNRIVPLKDSWAKEAVKAAPTGPRTEAAPRRPRPVEAEEERVATAAAGGKSTPPLSLSPEEAARLAELRPSLEPIVARVLAEHSQEVARFRAGKNGLLGFFVAEVRKASGGQADLRLASALLAEKLAGAPQP